MVAQSFEPTFLLTRPAAQSLGFAQTLGQTFPTVKCIMSPLMQTEFRDAPLPAVECEAAIFTSQAGVEGAIRLGQPGGALPRLAYCVGSVTQNAARLAGFVTLASQHSAQELLAMIVARSPSGPLVYFRGRDVSFDISGALGDHGIATHSVTVYAQTATRLTPAAIAQLSGTTPTLLPVFSVRSAQMLCQQVSLIVRPSPLWCAALSPAIAKELLPLGCQKRATATMPNADALITAIHVLLAPA
jgi:uroporphyrinogen-III synthase